MSTPIETEQALFMDEPYPSYIVKGLQTLYADIERFPDTDLGAPLTLVGAKAYGIIKLEAPTDVNFDDFEKARDAHRIDLAKQIEYVRERPVWKDGPFYLYKFSFTPFPSPLDYEVVEESLEKACSRKRTIKKLSLPAPVVKEEPKVCPKCKKDPCECEPEKEEVKKSVQAPEFFERPMAYDVVLHPTEDGWTLNESTLQGYSVTLMTKTTGDLTEVKIHKLSFDKTLCPCSIAKIDYAPFLGWSSTITTTILPDVKIDKKS